MIKKLSDTVSEETSLKFAFLTGMPLPDGIHNIEICDVPYQLEVINGKIDNVKDYQN